MIIRHRSPILCLLVIFMGMVPVWAQTLVKVTGRVVDSVTGEPLAGITVRIRSTSTPVVSDPAGNFTLHSATRGSTFVTFTGASILYRELPVQIPSEGVLPLGDVKVDTRPSDTGMYAGVIEEQELEIDDDASGLSQNVSTMVIFSNDVFLRKSGFRFSPFRYRVRGYESRFEEKYINGVNFNQGVRGTFNYSSLGALNDMTRNGDVVHFMTPGTFTFGSISGSENINMRPADFAKGGRVTASLTNRNYIGRAMYTISTGLRDDGWALTASIGGRYANRGAIPGTFYRNLSYALGAEKVWDDGRHRLSVVTFGSPVVRGQQGSSFQEANDLVGTNLYNPNWGIYQGKVRNAKVVTAFDPTAILSHVWKIDNQSRLTTGLAAHYSRYGGTALNWYNGPDPRPDYYRYLPSYQTSPIAKDYYTYLWRICPVRGGISQLNWDRMYRINDLQNRFGTGSAIYMLEERRSDLTEGMLNSTYNTSWTEQIHFSAGVEAKLSLAHQFKTVDDLLGAEHLLDVDKFAERDFPGDRTTIQNDLERPDRKVFRGDIFGYDFLYHIYSAGIWAQQEHRYHNWDIYYGTKLKYTGIQREGKMRNGRYPNSSFGRGEVHRFVDYGLKVGATYKFTGRHLLSTNLSYQTVAPPVEQLYISPRITDSTPERLQSAGVFTADLGYTFSTPSISGRLSGFYTYINDDMKRVSYYHDSERTFVNHLLSHLDKRYMGLELGVNYKANDHWNFDFVGTVADYRYASHPLGEINYENGKGQTKSETVYMKSYHIGGLPEFLGTIGANYFYRYWFISANLNGYARNYIEIAPLRRIASNYESVTPPGTIGFDETAYNAYRKLTNQEKFPGGYTVDLSIGKIFYLKNRNALNFNLSINNLTNRTNIRTGGYEQGRISLEYPERFASKYFYMQGINAYLNVSYRFK